MDNPIIVDPSAALPATNSGSAATFNIAATANPNVAAPATPTVATTANPNVAATPNPSTPAAANPSTATVAQPTGTAASNSAGAKSSGAAAAKSSGAAAGKTAMATGGQSGGASFANMNGAALAKPGAFGAASLYGGPAAQMSGGKLLAGGLLGKLALLFVVIPFGAIFAGVLYIKSRKPKARQRKPRIIPRRTNIMRKLFAGRMTLILLTLVTIGMGTIGGRLLYEYFRVYNITIAAGDPKAESFVLMSALQAVTQRYYPRIKIVVHATGGTSDSLKRLEQGEAQFAAGQADIAAGPSANSVAVLFEDTFQLLVHNNAASSARPSSAKQTTPAPAIGRFADLKGKKIALPKGGGQFKSFLTVAAHFGLKETDFTFLGGDDEGAEVAFAKNEADAIFRVRALHNASITKLVQGGNVSFVPIEDAAGMRVEAPAYGPAVIPKGAYLGEPPADLPTIQVPRILLVRKDVPDYVVRSITQVLMDRRQDLAAAIPAADEAVRPTVAQIAQPILRAGLGASIHPGAMAYYEHDQSSFVGRHADLIAVTLFVCLLGGMWFVELRRSSTIGQKNHADEFNRKMLVLMHEVSDSETESEVEAVRSELMRMLTQAIADLDRNRLSEPSFHSFHTVWQIAINLVNDREKAIAGRYAATHHLNGGYTVTPADMTSPHANLAKMLQPRASGN